MSQQRTLTPIHTPKYLTLKEASALGYGAYSTLRDWINDGRLPAVKIGGRVKLTLEDLEALKVVKPAKKATTPQQPSNDLDPAIQRIVDQAPKLTPEQREKLAQVLGGVL